MNVIVDRARCEGHGICELTSPTVYEVDDEGFVRVLTDHELPLEVRSAAEAGALACPVAALRLTA